tara:strand:+ start:14491 stop:17628 length:3138 start_codon:yes stop_codon:yes gene_type:complete
MESIMTYGYKLLASNSIARILIGSFVMMVMTFATSLNVQGQTVLSEQLRDGTAPTGWTSTDVDFTTSASGYAKFTGVTGVLTSPSFDLSGVTGATLNYSVAKFGSGDDGPLTVEFSIDGGTTWDAFVANSDTATSSTYLNEELELAANLIGESNVMVRFTTANSPSFKRVRDVLLVGPNGVTLDPATDVATIADLRAGTADGTTRYRLTGEAVIAFYDSFNKRRYLVDATAGIFSEDPGNLPDTLTNIGDGIAGIEGTLSLVNNGALLRFNPDEGSTNLTVTTGNELQPETIALIDLSLDDTGKLVTIPGVTFQETGAFSSGTNYTVEDSEGNTLTFRTDYFGADYIGETIPTEKLNITGLVGGFGSNPQIFARSSADIEVLPNTVDVTFTVNMATVNDTVSSNYEVSINGYFRSTGLAFASGETTDWSSDATAQLTNIGGDYWQGTFKMVQGDTLHYKYRYNLENVAGRDEAGVTITNPDGNDLRFVIANSDTTLGVEYFNTVSNATIAETEPFVTDPDSITVYFRVNMGGKVQNESFNPATDIVGVRGSGVLFGADWSSGTTLTKETEDRLEGNVLFYSTAVKIAKTSADTVNTIEYKFVEGATDDGSVGWEDNIGGNRSVKIPAADSTIQWVYFDNVKPTSAKIITTDLNFEVNVGILEGLGFFNTSIDTVIVTGSFDNFQRTEQMDFSSLTGTYATSFPFIGAVGSDIPYKYYIKWDSRRDVSTSEFFLEGITADGSGWEEPGIFGGGNRTFELQDAPSQPTLSRFYNDVSPEARLTANNVETGAISVTFSIDMSPALDQTTAFVPATDSVFLFIDTPFFALTNDIIVPGDEGQNFSKNTPAQMEKLRFTDGDDDMVYTLDLDLMLPTLNNIGFRVAYGEPTSADGQLIANGGGFDAGRRHYQYIQPQVDANLNVTWPSTFAFPQLTWAEKDLPFELPPSYTTVSNEDELTTVETFRLNQNYPNPFNPSTTISFDLPNAADVTLSVYNVLGQRVATLLNNKKYTSGSHTLSFNATNLASGVYIYRLEAGAFTSLKRMTLIK